MLFTYDAPTLCKIRRCKILAVSYLSLDHSPIRKFLQKDQISVQPNMYNVMKRKEKIMLTLYNYTQTSKKGEICMQLLCTLFCDWLYGYSFCLYLLYIYFLGAHQNLSLLKFYLIGDILYIFIPKGSESSVALSYLCCFLSFIAIVFHYSTEHHRLMGASENPLSSTHSLPLPTDGQQSICLSP